MARPTRHGKKWRIRWVDETGNRRSEVHDTFEKAQAALAEHQSNAAARKRGDLRPRCPDRTFGDLCDWWLRVRAPLKRSRRDDESMIRRHLRPHFGALRLRDFMSEHAATYQAAKLVGGLSPKTVSNHLTLLSAMLIAAANDLNWLHTPPKIQKPRIHTDTYAYRYLKTKQEVARFLTASRPERPLVYMLYRTALTTGLRAGELSALTWTDVNLDTRLITVAHSYERNAVTKSGRIRYVPILDPLFETLTQWKRHNHSDIVFPNASGRHHKPSSRIFQERLQAVLARANFPMVELNGKPARYITFHGLRHTFASHWVMQGGSVAKLQKILGHASMEMTLRYAHLSPDLYKEDHDRLQF